MNSLKQFWTKYHIMGSGSPPIIVVGRWAFGGVLVVSVLSVLFNVARGDRDAVAASIGVLPGAALLYGLMFVSVVFARGDARAPSGRYRVTGVDRATKMDTTWYCNADSPEAAKVKADLEGITATRVEFEPS